MLTLCKPCIDLYVRRTGATFALSSRAETIRLLPCAFGTDDRGAASAGDSSGVFEDTASGAEVCKCSRIIISAPKRFRSTTGEK